VTSTEALLVFGAATAVLFPVVMTVEGARRPGYHPAYHTGSELELGPGGWVQRANFLLVSAGFAAVGIGAQRTLDTTLGPVLLVVASAGLVIAASFAPDPVRGYPPGASSRTARPETVHAQVHESSGPLVAVALFGACLALTPRLAGPWATYTVATAVVGLVSTVWLIAAYRRDAAYTGLVQRAFIATYWLWITVLGLHLVTR